MEYSGGDYWFRALSGLGQTVDEDLQKAIERHKELQKQKEFADDTIGYMARNPDLAAHLMSDKDKNIQDALNRYHSVSVSQKVTMASAALANFNMDEKMKQQQALDEERKAMAEYRKAMAQKAQEAAIPSPLGMMTNPGDPNEIIGYQQAGKQPRILTPEERMRFPDDPTQQQQQPPQAQGALSRFSNWFGGQANAMQQNPPAEANFTAGDQPIQPTPPQPPQPGMVRVKSPTGQTGWFPKGKALPQGWTVIG